MNEIIIIAEGYSRSTEDGNMEANCSCVLIKGQGVNVIVDTMTPWDTEFLLHEISKYNIQPKDINYVISTHGHSDHLGNNNLFLEAIHIVGQNISKGHTYYTHDFQEPYSLPNGIQVMKTPGHTMSCVSVLVPNSNITDEILVITGDLFEKEDDIVHEILWIEAGSEDLKKQRENRVNIARLAEYIIPGHGAMFKVNEEYRYLLQEQFETLDD